MNIEQGKQEVLPTVGLLDFFSPPIEKYKLLLEIKLVSIFGCPR